MKAIQVLDDTAEHSLVWSDVPNPEIALDEVLVRVHATALNRADLLQRSGKYPPPPGAPNIMGLEMAGEIVQVGRGVRGWQKGQAVCALLAGGGYAEYVAVPASLLMPVPDGWSMQTAAAMPETFLTAYVNIFSEAEFAAREIVLVHGGGSGVGTAAIQLVKAAGGTVLVTVRTPEKATACLKLGADLAINYSTQDFVAESLAFTQKQGGVDIVLDMVGGSYLERNLKVLQPKGRLVLIATQQGATATLDIRTLMSRRLRLIGSVLRGRSVAEKSKITHEFMEQFGGHLHRGSIKPVIDSVFPIQQVELAHERMQRHDNFGKIVLTVVES
ncbi:MAG TPA: NAD(P)H-quinone oxidoreductase [Anaerolineales bacterium]|nr:NAD(P)H-quinone oxidoreductase [Anaerolineales bacterium]